MTEQKKTRGSKGIRPHTWKTGPDPLRHDMYHPWQLAKAQAKFRGEEFTLTFEQYYEVWKDDWHNRGRKPEDLCMTRIDWEGAWEWGNVEIIRRKDHFIRQGLNRNASL